jgi:tRNA nucleotidyltransferase (CCA-adding enzyme)
MTNEIPSKALNIMALLRSAGARDVLIVGGFVRDSLLGIQSKDVDIEVYGMPVDAIVATLAPHFSLDVVGKSFGVIKIDNEIDVSIPRRESKIGMGHRDFKIDPDPNMTVEDAAARRDFTINSMAMREDGTIVDPFNGRRDLLLPVLRATSKAFQEDALRVLRAMQFAARFAGPIADHNTMDMARAMYSEFDFLPKERIWEEWKKFATKGRDAFYGFLVLTETEWIKHFPELNAMIGVPQDPEWHPEGCVWTHTVLVVQEAINIAIREQLGDEDRMILFFAALCHDMAKPATTKMEGGRWRAKGHCEQGADIAESFLNRIGAPKWLINHVKPLVVAHLVHSAGKPTDRAVRRLALRLRPSNINMLSMLIEADHSGRPPLPKGNPFIEWTEAARKLNIAAVQPTPILRGRDLIAIGVKPGREMGPLLDKAFEAQLDGAFSNLDEAIVWFERQQNVT